MTVEPWAMWCTNSSWLHLESKRDQVELLLELPLGQSQCVWYCSKALKVMIYETPSLCRKRCMFWWWLTLMLQAEPNQRQLTGGTGWSWTYRYSNSVSNHNSLVCFGDGDTDSICYWIRNSYGTNLWSSGIFSLKLCIFIISGLTWHDLCLHLRWGRSQGWKIMNGF